MLKFALAAIAVALISQNSFALECHGTEPFWGATLTEDNLSLQTVDIEGVTETKITKVAGAAGMVEEFLQVYSNEDGPVAVVRKTDSCSNGMSDETFPQEIIILSGDTNLYGCCGEPLPVNDGENSK
ncbi:MAG: hypothetical protein V4596_04280 [Bdellovibrionota bacterium]